MLILSQLTGKTSPLVGNYLKSQVMTSCLCFFSRFARGSFECLRLIASRYIVIIYAIFSEFARGSILDVGYLVSRASLGLQGL